jgi:DNA-binding NtrC family response regulator
MVSYFSIKFKKPILTISPDAMRALEHYPWPGNIRQLENAVQQAVLLNSGYELSRESLPMNICDHVASTASAGKATQALLTNRKENAERSVIHRTLQDHKFNRSRAANALGISRVTLYKKMKKYGISPSFPDRIGKDIDSVRASGTGQIEGNPCPGRA